MSEEIKTLKDINLKEDRLYTGSREFAKDVLIPGLKVASKLDITTGYFSSKSLVLLSKGLYTFLKREKKSGF